MTLAAVVGGGAYTQTLGSSSRSVSLVLLPLLPVRTRYGKALVTAARCTLSGIAFTVLSGSSLLVKVDGSLLVLAGAVLDTGDGWSNVTLNNAADWAVGLDVAL